MIAGVISICGVMNNLKHEYTGQQYEPAFIIGNGKSREQLDLQRLIGQGCTFGCNAMYRDFKPDYILPDYLVAIDPLLIEEIKNSDFPKDRFIEPPFAEQFEPAECNPARPRSNAGMNAMLEAIKKGFSTLYMFGFDFILDDPTFSVQNLYDGSNGYGPETRASYNDNINRSMYMTYIAQKNPNVNFKFVLPRDQNKIHTINSNNVTGMYYESFDPEMR